MPSATMHLTHAELLGRDPELPTELREAMQQELPCTRLGSVLVDLPFYTNIIKMMVGYWLEMPAENCPFAQKMHRYHPDLFAWHMARSVTEDAALPRAQRLAIMAGFLSHVALDLELHPLVNWIARREVILHGGIESHHHRLTEKYQSLFFHKELQGEDIVGTIRVFTETTRIVDHRAFFRADPEPPVVRWCTDVLAGHFHESAPSFRQFAAWVRAFRHFGFVVSLPPARQNSQRLGNAINRERYYENDEFSYLKHYQHGYRRSVELLNLAYEVVEAGDFSHEARRDFLRRAQIADLAYPPEIRPLPALPDYRELVLDEAV